jgi:hypothetical protein
MGAPIIRFESGQTVRVFEELVDSGDAITFEASFAPVSNAAGFEPVVAPYGLMTGGAITPDATNNTVSVAALTASMAGVAGADSNGVIAVSAGTVAITRPATAVSKVNSITINSSGAIAAVAGTDGSTTAFSETRGAAGGPPFIPVGSIEIGQVRVVSNTAAAITSAQIYTVVGLHVERSDYPVRNELDYATGEVTFADALPLIHTGGVAKKVFMRGATPLFSAIPNASDWTPAESTYGITSTSTYDGPVGSASSSLGQASFTAVLRDGISDDFLAQKGKDIWFEFRPDRDKLLPKQLTQGVLGISRSFPSGGGSPTGDCTVTPRVESVDVRA